MNIETVRNFLSTTLTKISAETLGWLAAMLFAWAGLVLMFLRAVVLKDLLNIITIGLGFIVQAVLMALILFK